MATPPVNVSEDAAKLLQRITPALQEARQKLESLDRRINEPIAIVGMGLRFPGAGSPEAFWDLLRNGVDMVTQIPADRWRADDYFDPRPGQPGKMYIREAAFVDGVDQFDAAFFGISPREAASLDPQHRILLEVVWEALERAGIAPDRLLDSPTGVFVGMSENDYSRLENTGDRYNVYATTGNSNYFAAGRLSYLLGLQGPNLMIDTACSSSLVAVHLACQSLRLGECDMALAGGVQLMLMPEPMIATAQLSAFAPDGRCKTFDDSADGYGRGEGCGIIVLKRLRDALAAGDRILAVLRGSAVNHGGRSGGLTAPSKAAQEALLRQALRNAKVQPSQVSYVEAHGTGTQLGDPIEVGALTSVFGASRSEPLWIGSVKTNIGHLEPASGIAGLLKAVLAIQEKQIPPSLHFKTPSRFIDWAASPVRVSTECAPWSTAERIAGVTALGMSGTNCHVIVGEAPLPEETVRANGPERPLHILILSAKNDAALQSLAARYSALCRESPDLPLADLCYSANMGRNLFSRRLSVICQSVAELANDLAGFPRRLPARMRYHAVPENQLSPRIAFVFAGQAAQGAGVGRDLYETQPTFRAAIDECDWILRSLPGGSILENHTEAALFALEYALATLWKSWGVEPDVVVGQGVGEYAAACVADVFSLEDALKLIASRTVNEVEQVASTIRYAPPRVSFISSVTNQFAAGEVATPEYWLRHARAGARFDAAAKALQEQSADILLEMASPDWRQILSLCVELQGRGVAIDWVAFDKDYRRNKLLLPTYPFQRERHWVNVAAPEGPQSVVDSGKPDLRMIRLPLEEKTIFETEFSLEQMPYLQDHKILGEVVVPGACLLSMLLDAALAMFPEEAHELSDILFHQPLRLAAGETRTVHGVLTPDGSAGLSCRVLSFPTVGVLNETATVHATSTLSISLKLPPPSADLNRIRQTCQQEVAHSTWYNQLVENGILLGPFFGWIAGLWRGGSESLGRLRLPRCVAGIERHALHGALLDSCFIVANDAEQAVPMTKLPFSVESLRLYRAAAGEEWWCFAQQVENGKFNFQLLDQMGMVVAEVRGLADKEASPKTLFKTTEVRNGAHRVWNDPAAPALRHAKLTLLPDDRKFVCEKECEPEIAGLEIFGQPIVPISYSVSLLAQMAQHLFTGAAYELKELVFHKPLAILKDETRSLQAIVDLGRLYEPSADRDRPEMDFQLVSFPNTAGAAGIAEVYASGTMLASESRPPTFLAIDELLKRCNHHAAFDDWYPRVSEKGYGVGPSYYSWMSRLWRGDDQTLTRLRLPEGLRGIEGDPLYFALFHGCIMGTNALFLHEDAIVRTPYAIESMRVYGPATGDEWWCYSRRIGESKYDFQLLNSRGLVLAEIEGYSERAVTAEETFFTHADSEQWLYQVDWELQAGDRLGEPAEASLGAPAGCLIVAEDATTGAALAERLTAGGMTAQQFGTAPLPAGILESLPSLQLAVYVAGIDDTTSGHPAKQAQDRCTGFLTFAQALLNAYQNPPASLIVTRDAQAVADSDQVGGFAQSSLSALAKVVALEHPEMACVCMDIGREYSREDAVAAIVAELTRSTWRQEAQLACRAGQVYAARLNRYRSRAQRSVEIRSDGAYLITGGRGGLGLKVTQWLVEHGARHLLLLGRTEPSLEVRADLADLERIGAHVTAAVGDVRDEQALARIIADLPVPLCGVIHASGVLDDASLLHQTPAGMNRVFSPKADGAWNLHCLTLRQPLDFFVMFSSASALLGAAGQANYAAANAFLDALAAHRQRLGLPGLSVAWGSWDQVGMTAREGLLEKLQRGGEQPIPVLKGLDVFGELLNEPVPQIGVISIDWARFSMRTESTSRFYEKLVNTGPKSRGPAGSTRTREAEEIRQKLREAGAEDRVRILEAHLRTLVAQLLDIDAAALPNEEGVGFATLGLDSLTSIELRNSLQRTLNCSLPLTFSFDYPTIEAAVKYLAQYVLGGETPAQQPQNRSDATQTETSGDEDASLSAALERLATWSR